MRFLTALATALVLLVRCGSTEVEPPSSGSFLVENSIVSEGRSRPLSTLVRRSLRQAEHERQEALARFAAWVSWQVANDPDPTCPGRFAIPESIVWRESRCQRMAKNKNSTASGPYQMIRGSFGTAVRSIGLPKYEGMLAMEAPLSVQSAAAAWLWADSPCHWAPNRWC